MTISNSEQVLSRVMTGHGALVLTSHRVVYGWRTRFTVISLADVNTVGVTRLTRRWIAFVLAVCVVIALCLIGAIVFGLKPIDIPRQQASALLFLSAFLLVTFGVKRWNVVHISSPQASIRFRVSNFKRKQVAGLLLDLDQARARRQPAARGQAPRPERQTVTKHLDRELNWFGETRLGWLTEALGSVAAYTPVAVVAAVILWTGIKLILSMWRSSFSK